jgi:hypothetical protein
MVRVAVAADAFVPPEAFSRANAASALAAFSFAKVDRAVEYLSVS